MIKEIYIKGKFESGVGAAAYVIVGNGQRLQYGSKQFGEYFEIGGETFKCDQFNCEILAAICGVARCGDDLNINIYSNNQSVIKWMNTAEEPLAREDLMNIYRTYVCKKDVLVTYIPYHTKDQTDNQWNAECEMLAQQALYARNS